MLRQLSHLEAFYIDKNVNILTISDLIGHINPLLLQKAIALVVMRHPLLSSEVQEAPEGYGFYPRSSYTDKLGIKDAVDKEKRKSIIHAELNNPLQNNSLVRFTLLLEERIGILKAQKVSLLMMTHHAVSDGVSCVALQEEVWKAYAELSENKEPTTTTYPIQPAVDELIPNHFTQAELSDYIKHYIETANHYNPYTVNSTDPGDTPIEIKFVRKKFTIKQTQALVQKCQEKNLTVHAAVSAAHALAMRELSGQETIDVSCSSPINIRPLLTPPLTNNALVTAAIGVTHYQSITADTSLESLGNNISETIEKSINNGEIFKSLLTANETRLKVYIATSFGISNLGVVQLPPLSNKLKFVSMNFIARFPLPMLTAYAATSDHKLSLYYPFAKPYYSSSTVSKLATLAEKYLFQ